MYEHQLQLAKRIQIAYAPPKKFTVLQSKNSTYILDGKDYVEIPGLKATNPNKYGVQISSVTIPHNEMGMLVNTQKVYERKRDGLDFRLRRLAVVEERALELPEESPTRVGKMKFIEEELDELVELEAKMVEQRNTSLSQIPTVYRLSMRN